MLDVIASNGFLFCFESRISLTLTVSCSSVVKQMKADLDLVALPVCSGLNSPVTSCLDYMSNTRVGEVADVWWRTSG
jgi:hypothetical protein